MVNGNLRVIATNFVLNLCYMKYTFNQQIELKISPLIIIITIIIISKHIKHYNFCCYVKI